MSFFKRIESRTTIDSYVLSAYLDKSFELRLMPNIIDEFAKKYVDENYDELVKQVDTEAFKQQLTIALATQAAIKAMK